MHHMVTGGQFRFSINYLFFFGSKLMPHMGDGQIGTKSYISDKVKFLTCPIFENEGIIKRLSPLALLGLIRSSIML